MGPTLVNVVGLKKSGKTTVTEALVAKLRSRGYTVGTIKSMVWSTLSLDIEGKDTWRHSRSGADFVIALSKGETVLMERHGDLRRTFRDIERLIPDGTQFVISEGLEDDDVEQLQVCCLRSMEDLDETRKVRGIRDGRLIAISGLVASKGGVHPELPVLDVMDPAQLGALADLVLDRSLRPSPAGRPGGPLSSNEGWRPGVLPPGEFPEVPDLSDHGGDQ
jgi:molybdopterin-guanine dinucleotide biosynthesis protein B